MSFFLVAAQLIGCPGQAGIDTPADVRFRWSASAAKNGELDCHYEREFH
jgi:hypothetical protein